MLNSVITSVGQRKIRVPNEDWFSRGGGGGRGGGGNSNIKKVGALVENFEIDA